MKQQMQNDQKGFTLIELMIVIAIIGILAAIAIPNYISYRDKAFCSSAESDANAIASGLSSYFAIPSNQTFAVAGPVTGTTIIFPGSGTIQLSGTNTGTVKNAGAGAPNSFVISVTDVSTRCPFNYRSASATSRWNNPAAAAAGTAGTYIMTM